MRNVLLSACAVVALSSGAAQAQPTFCTGTTDTVSDGGSVTAAFLLTAGNCVEAGDKVFGATTTSGAITGNGSASFTFLSTPGNVTIGFAGVVTPNSTGSLVYTVAVDPALSKGFLIDDLEKDFTLNAANEAAFATATLTGTTTADPSFSFDCTRTVNPSASSCPQQADFANVAEMTVDETIAAGSNAVVTALTDTISQAPAPVREAAGWTVLLVGLFGTAWVKYHQRRRHEERERLPV